MLFDEYTKSMSGDSSMPSEARSFIMEAAMLESLTADEIDTFVSNCTETTAAVSEGVVLEKTIVRLDKKAKLSRAYKAAIFTIAKEKNDPKFKKLITVWKMERSLESYLEKKYGNEAMRRAKKAIADSARSNSSVVQKVAKTASKKLK